MNVILITHTPNPEQIVSTAARLCYSGDDIATTMEHIVDPNAVETLYSE